MVKGEYDMKNTKRSLLTSLTSLLLCFAMLLGTTFAWFTDVSSSKGNKIVSGNLEFDLEVLDETTKQWYSIKESKEPLFHYENWAPGYTDVTVLKVENEGSVALKWIARFVTEEALTKLADVIDVYTITSDTEIDYPTNNDLTGYTKIGTIKEFVNGLNVTNDGVLYPEGSTAGVSESYLGVALKMQESVGNDYQNMTLNGGSFDIKILATQYGYEGDSFSGNGDSYDEGAQYPTLATQIKYLTNDTDYIYFDLSNNGNIIATMNVPAAAVADPTYPVTVTITDIDPSETIIVGENTKAFAYDIEVTNLKSTLADDELITVTLNMPNALPSAKVYHKGELVNNAVYDEVAGTITFKTDSFSPYAVTWKERTASTAEELRDVITGDDDVYIRLTGDIEFICDPTMDGFNGSNKHMAKSSTYTYYNGVNIVGKNIAIDLNGHNITSSGDTGAIFFVTPNSSLNITDTVGGGTVTAKDLCYVIWAPYDTPSFCDIYNGIFVTDSYAGVTDTSKYGRAIVYAGEGGNINVYGGYYLYNNTPDDATNTNNGAFNVMDNYIPEENPCLTVHDGVMLINQYYKQSTGKDDATVKLAEGCSVASVTLGTAVAGYKNWYQVQTDDPIVEIKFENTDKYTYRVGNMNTVALGSLFNVVNTISSNAKFNVTINAIDNSSVSGVYTANSDWSKSTIKFSGTGLAKITVNGCELVVEVVDAMNATGATSAKANNVVLLNNVGFSTIEVSGGYTLYGNGFKMTASSDYMYDTMNAGFVVLKNGTLDNVQIICPNFSYSIIYNNQIKDNANTAVPSDSSNDARGNVRSAVMVDGNSKIINSYVHGGRAAIFLRSGNLLVDNSTISGGAAATIHTIAAQSLTLRDATLIQRPFQATVHDTSKTIMGFCGLFECGEDGNSTPLIIEGTLIQDAWINESYTKYIALSTASTIVSNALKKTDYLHDLDGDGTKESLNLGFTYIPQNTGGSTNANATDNRTNKSEIPYSAVEVGSALASAKVYSYNNSKGTSSDFVVEGDYTPTAQGSTVPAINFSDTNADRVFTTVFDTSDNRWESTLTVNLDNGNYNFNFAKLLVQKYGNNLTYTVAKADGTAVSTSTEIALTTSGVTDYVLTVADENATHTLYFTITASKTSIPEPVVVDGKNDGTHLLVVKNKNSDWSCAINALDSVQVKYYTVDGEVLLDLSSFAPTKTGKLNDTNNYWEATNAAGCKLKITCGYIHDTKQIYGMPVGINNGGNKVYFTISSTNGYVSTSTSARSVTLTYEFTDPNGKTLKFSSATTFTYADYKNGTQYSYSDFVNGTLKEASGSSCVTADTLVTLANGTQKRIDQITYEDQLLAWNFFTGEYTAVPAAIIFDHGYDYNTVINLMFSDGTSVNVVNMHQFYNEDLNKFVTINAENVADFVGQEFAKNNGNGCDTVTLVDYAVSEEYVEAWGIISALNYNIFVNDMLSTDFMTKDYALFNYLEIGENMMFDAEKMQSDIETYGLYTYEDFAEYLTYEQFVAFNVQYFKISVEKGYYTYDGIVTLIYEYLYA